MVEPHYLGRLLPYHAGRDGGPHRSQLGCVNGPLYGLSILWGPGNRDLGQFYVEQGFPTTPVLLWLSGDQLRAVCENVVVAEYRCHYDWRRRHVTNIRDGVFYLTRYASSQGALIPFNPQESRVLYRPPSGKRRRPQTFPTQQLLLFEWIPSA